MIKFTDGSINKGHMESNERNGIWDIYTPEDDENFGYWSKQEYINGKLVRDLYD